MYSKNNVPQQQQTEESGQQDQQVQESRPERQKMSMLTGFSRLLAFVRARLPLRSLRLRLLLSLGILLISALGLFAVLTLVSTTDAINQSVDNAIRSEARVALLDVDRSLSPQPPYWPQQFSLHAVDTYRDPGVAVEVLDEHGQVRSRSANDTATSIPISEQTMQAALAGQTIWYTTTINSEQARVEALPVRLPNTDATGNTLEAPSSAGSAQETLPAGGPVVGVLLVAKSLEDVQGVLGSLRTLLLLVGLVTLGGMLVISWGVAARVLHPLAAIATTARSIVTSTVGGKRIGSLSQRIPDPGGRDEIAQVVGTLNEMLASLERATQSQRRFVADASHELRAPLTTIQGNLAFLQRHQDELPAEERQAMLNDAHEEALRLSKLVDDLLQLARADASTETTRIANEEAIEAEKRASLIELDHALLQLMRQLRSHLGREGSHVQLEVGHIEPVRVRGDEESLRRVMLILLDNAIKYTAIRGEQEEGRITVSLQCIDGQAVLRVRDTGIGIDPADLPHLFERFYRADTARSRQGTGLGLSIAQTLVEQFGGHITAESTLGKGSTFSVWLPCA
jgi:two-component system OmpR family sensor kinase